MTTLNIYLNFDGNCREAFLFYKSVFGGEFTYISTFKDMPVKEGDKPVSEKIADRIMHVSLPISKETILMGSDIGEAEWALNFKQGNNFSISVNTDQSRTEAERIFVELSDRGKITMPMGDTFWGDYFGMLTDKFGINWLVSFNENAFQ